MPGPASRIHLSPDEHWLMYTSPQSTGVTRVLVASVPAPGRLGQPIELTDGQFFDFGPQWSPNGNVVYFISDRDGFRCLWALRLNPVTKHAADKPFPVAHFHEARRSAMELRAADLNLSVARDKAVFVLSERTGNIWMAEIEN